MLQNIELEFKAIVIMLNDPLRLGDGMVMTPAHFSDRIARETFVVMKSLYTDDKPVTPITVTERAHEIKDFRLKDILDATFASSHEMEFIIERLEDARKGRQIYEICKDVEKRIPCEQSQNIVDEMSERILSIGSQETETEVLDGKELALRAIGHVADRLDGKRRYALYTGYGSLDRLTGGLETGDLVIVSGKTGEGKSAFCQNLFKNICVNGKMPGLYINSEMSEEQMSLRWAAMLTKNDLITNTRLRCGELSDSEIGEAMNGLNKLYESRFSCVTIPELDMDKVSSVIRRHQKRNGCVIAAVDYVGRMDTQSRRDSREDQILVAAAKRLKTLAQQLKMVIVMVAQKKSDGKLQSASYMENESDLHLSLEKLAEPRNGFNYWLWINKGRNCPSGVFTGLWFDGAKLTFKGEA